MPSRKIPRAAWIVIGIVCLFAVVFGARAGILGYERPKQEMSFYAVDSFGQKIYGFESETAGVWYLFVPGAEDIGALTLYVSPDITEVSSGWLNRLTGAVVGLFAEGNEAILSGKDEKITIKVKKSELSGLHVILKNVTIHDWHSDKDAKHRGNSIYLSDPSGKYRLVVEDSVEIKGRGNSSWVCFDKKGYQLKFDEKVSVLGMERAKKWVLLANACDDSMMRTQLTYLTASQLGMDFVPEFEYVDLWINGEYRGTYMIGEKVEIFEDRLDLDDPMGVLFEHDEAFWQEEEIWIESKYLSRHFALKEAVNEIDEELLQSAISDFRTAVDELAEYLFSTPVSSATLEELSAMIDVDSFVDYYLINEYTQNRESFATSFYWYKDGAEDVLHLGPIWDYDTCMGNDGTDYTGRYGEQHVLFRHLLAIPAFRQRVLERAESLMPLFKQMDETAWELYDKLRTSAEMNYLRWDVLGKPNPKGGTDFAATYEQAVENLTTWLENRETAFAVPEVTVATATVSEDCRELTIRYEGGEDWETVRFAVWSEVNDQDDFAWYDGTRDENGVWSAVVDLSAHFSAGIYRYSVYHDEQMDSAAAIGRAYVETATEPLYRLDSQVTDDGETMTITLFDSGLCSSVTFAVWGEANGQDDLRWYEAVKQEDGRWICTVELALHPDAGVYHIHAYDSLATDPAMVAFTNVTREPAELRTP